MFVIAGDNCALLTLKLVANRERKRKKTPFEYVGYFSNTLTSICIWIYLNDYKLQYILVVLVERSLRKTETVVFVNFDSDFNSKQIQFCNVIHQVK